MNRMTFEVQSGPPTTLTRRLVSALPVTLGVAILAGGPHRFGSPSFAVPREYAPWWVWGLGFIAVGIVMTIRSWRSAERVFWPAAIGAFLFGIWTVGLILSTLVGPLRGQASFTGIAVYGWVTVTLAALAARDPHPALGGRA